MARRLFCEISPLAYRISAYKERLLRRLSDMLGGQKWAGKRSASPLPSSVYRHGSLIRRRLGNVNMELQENKALNLSLAAPKVNGILIAPGETFSFWRLVGSLKASKGYRPGLTISKGRTGSGVGGGMCQFTNLIHWLVLHSPLVICEHHHHNGLDLFPDFGRQIPFGTGTSIVYNYLDYRFYNPTENTFQLLTRVEGEYLTGELRCETPLTESYHVREEGAFFTEEEGVFYRHNQIFLKKIDNATGRTADDRLILSNRARVCYDPDFIDPAQIRRENESTRSVL